MTDETTGRRADNSSIAIDRDVKHLMLVYGRSRKQRRGTVEIPEPWTPSPWEQYNDTVQWLIQTAHMNDALAGQSVLSQREQWRARDGARGLRELARELIDDDD